MNNDTPADETQERSPLELVAFAAWVNCPVDKIPEEYRAPTCPHTMASWKRVADAILATRTPSLAAQDDWRCHHCKRVVASVTEPEQCAHCKCLAFSKCDPAPSLAAQDGLVDALRNVLKWLKDPQMATWTYVEGNYFYRDVDAHAKAIEAALASIEVKSTGEMK